MTFNRLLAKFLDLLVVAALAAFPTWVATAAALTYALAADGLAEGQSIGKKIVGLRVTGEDGRPCDFVESLQRNLTVVLGLVLLFQRVPFLWPLLWLGGAAVLLLEAFLVVTDDEALRLGDRFSHTRVVEAPRLGARKA